MVERDLFDTCSKGNRLHRDSLESDISAAEVANHVGASQWHFQRTFKALTNETLISYIRSRRLTNSLDRLLNTDFRIIDIGLAAGDENQESYTRAFRRSFNKTPMEYRKNGLSLEPAINILPPRRFVGLKTYFYGIIQQQSEPQEQLAYFACVETNAKDHIPQGMDEILIPGTTYARFTDRGEVSQLDNTVNYIYANWLLNSDHQHPSGPDPEIYGSGYQSESSDSVIYYSITIA